MDASRIYWVGGGKGGVGKSMVSMALMDHLVAKQGGSGPLLIESDTSNPDVYKAYRNAASCELVDLDEVDGWIHLVNLCEANKGRDVVVNTAARNNLGVRKFGATLRESLGELGREMVVFWAINRQRDSLELLRDFMQVMPGVTVNVLRNTYFGEEAKFELYAQSTVRQQVEAAGGRSLSFPDLADRVSDDLYRDRLTIQAAAEQLPIGNRAELKRWRSAVAQMLGAVVDGQG